MRKFALKGRFCTLVPLQEEHLPELVALMNDPEVNKYLRVRQQTLESKIERFHAMQRRGEEISLAVLVGESDTHNRRRFIGIAGYHNVSRENGTAQGRLIIDKTYQGRGIGKEARLLQLKHAFDMVHLRWVWGSAYSPNIRSIRLLEATGYQRIGIRPEVKKIDGVYVDEFLYAVSKNLWLPFWEAYRTR